MDFVITVPEALIPTIDTWRSTQLTPDGNFLKYADTQDLCQQNLNDGILTFFVNLFVQSDVATLQAQIDALKASVVLPAKKTPIPKP